MIKNGLQNFEQGLSGVAAAFTVAGSLLGPVGTPKQLYVDSTSTMHIVAVDETYSGFLGDDWYGSRQNLNSPRLPGWEVPVVDNTQQESVLTPEQKKVYDQINAIYAKYGTTFVYSEEEILSTYARKESEPVYDPGEILIVADGDKELAKSIQMLGLYSNLLGNNATKYIYVLRYISNDGQGGYFSFNPDALVNKQRHIGFTFQELSYARLIIIHEAVHAVDRNFGVQDVDTYLAMQLIKAQLILELHNPHSVWGNNYNHRYSTDPYSPYRAVGEYAVSYKVSTPSDPIQVELRDYIDGLMLDGEYSELDMVYVGLKVMQLKEKYPEYRFSDDLEYEVAWEIRKIAEEGFAAIVTDVLMGSGAFTDVKTVGLVEKFIQYARGDDVSIKNLQNLLRYGFYSGELATVPFRHIQPTSTHGPFYTPQ